MNILTVLQKWLTILTLVIMKMDDNSNLDERFIGVEVLIDLCKTTINIPEK